MNNLSLKQKIIAIIAIIGAILIFIFQRGLSANPEASVEKIPLEAKSAKVQTDTPELISTNPSPLEGTFLSSMQPVELNFNLPLENAPEFKHNINPKYEYKVELSGDKKTAKIIPLKPIPLGMTFTLSISRETKFDGKKTLDKDYSFHYKTIEYKGV